MKLTKAQKARAKRAVKADILSIAQQAWCGEIRDSVVGDDHEWPEVERLLKVALRAVERDRG